MLSDEIIILKRLLASQERWAEYCLSLSSVKQMNDEHSPLCIAMAEVDCMKRKLGEMVEQQAQEEIAMQLDGMSLKYIMGDIDF